MFSLTIITRLSHIVQVKKHSHSRCRNYGYSAFYLKKPTVLSCFGVLRLEGMNKIKTEKPDLLILDVMMSSWVDGLDMSKILKDDLQFKDMPILILTGVKERTIFDFRPRTGSPDWCLVDAYLDKPVEPDLLLTEIERLLSKKT
jgi:CheY-like chemotaxis protein